MKCLKCSSESTYILANKWGDVGYCIVHEPEEIAQARARLLGTPEQMKDLMKAIDKAVVEYEGKEAQSQPRGDD